MRYILFVNQLRAPYKNWQAIVQSYDRGKRNNSNVIYVKSVVSLNKNVYNLYVQ